MSDQTQSPRIFGPLMQVSYVVRDLDAAIRHWTAVMGVGPFFVLDHVGFDEIFYQGQPAAIDMAVAIAYSGGLQIELVQQHNAAPSIFRDFLARHGEGQQHVGVATDDLARDLEKLSARGVKPVQWGRASNGTLFAYVETDLYPGTMVEMVQLSPKLEKAFAAMRQAAETWDGVTAVAHRS